LPRLAEAPQSGFHRELAREAHESLVSWPFCRRRRPADSFPPAPRLRLLQSVAAGIDLIDTESVPKGVTICNVFGHEPAIAEYVIMTMLVLTHRLFEAVTAFARARGSRARNSAAVLRMARRWAVRLASSAMAGSGARWRSAPRDCNAVS